MWLKYADVEKVTRLTEKIIKVSISSTFYAGISHTKVLLRSFSLLVTFWQKSTFVQKTQCLFY